MVVPHEWTGPRNGLASRQHLPSMIVFRPWASILESDGKKKWCFEIDATRDEILVRPPVVSE
jgi:hypothetical protein